MSEGVKLNFHLGEGVRMCTRHCPIGCHDVGHMLAHVSAFVSLFLSSLRNKNFKFKKYAQTPFGVGAEATPLVVFLVLPGESPGTRAHFWPASVVRDPDPARYYSMSTLIADP